jgi:carboxyl-terminal processing protease
MATGMLLGVMFHQVHPLSPRNEQEVLLHQTIEYVKTHYVDEVTQQHLVDGALTGLFESLDPHSRFLGVDAMREIESEARGHYGGVGLEVSLVDQYFTVIRTLPGTPAENAGIEPGNQLTAVDGESLRGKRIGDVIQMLRGAPETDVVLEVRHGEHRRSMQLRRQRIDTVSVEGEKVEHDVGVIRISLFTDKTADEVKETLATLDNVATPLQGLILDLRNNPGGLLTSAVDVADLFLPDGLIVRTQGRSPESTSRYEATVGDIAQSLPLAILTDGATASAAEVVTGALQDSKRAVVVGSTTYGKGSVQTLFGINGKRGIKLTTARYYTPAGKVIDGKGIEPDVVWTGDYASLPAFAARTLQKTSISN